MWKQIMCKYTNQLTIEYLFIRSTLALPTILNVARNSSNSTTIVRIISIFVSKTSLKTPYSIQQPFFFYFLFNFMILDGFPVFTLQYFTRTFFLSVNFYWTIVILSSFFCVCPYDFCISVKQLAIFSRLTCEM